VNVTAGETDVSVAGKATSAFARRPTKSCPEPVPATRPERPFGQLVDPEAQMVKGASTSPITPTWPMSPKPLTTAHPEARVATPATAAAAASRNHLLPPVTPTPPGTTPRRACHTRCAPCHLAGRGAREGLARG
jgi:hypothetical protein